MIDQAVIVTCGVASVWLSQDHRQAFRRWACVFGIVAQPFWLYATAQAGQWGIFALSIVYAVGWIRGLVNFWLRPLA